MEGGWYTFGAILFSLFAGFMMWRSYRVLKANPSLLSKEAMSRSFGTAGFVALALIAFVSVLVLLLRTG